MSLLLEGILIADDDLNDACIPAIVGLNCILADAANPVHILPAFLLSLLLLVFLPLPNSLILSLGVASDPAVGGVTAIVGPCCCWFSCFYADVNSCCLPARLFKMLRCFINFINFSYFRKCFNGSADCRNFDD